MMEKVWRKMNSPYCWWECKLVQSLWRKICCCCCSVAQSCLTLCDSMDCSTPGFPVHHHLPVNHLYKYIKSKKYSPRYNWGSSLMLLLYPISFLIATFLMKSLNLSIFPNESYFLSSFCASVANLCSYPRALGCSISKSGHSFLA